MIISDSKKFVFVHIPKTGGMSVRSVLQQYATVPVWAHNTYKVKGQKNKQLEKHAKARTLIKFVKEAQWNEYFKFAFIRNPWDWLVSVYFYIKKDRADPRHALANRVTFPVFVEWFSESDSKKFPIKLGQLDYITASGKIVVDFVGKFENIRKDFGIICSRIGFTQNIGHVNRTMHKNYRNYYDKRSRNLVYNLFKKDIKHFSYRF